MLRTGVPRVRPSVGFMQMARTRLSPSCWATSASTMTGLPSTCTVNSSAVLSFGQRAAGELDVDHGAGDADDAAVCAFCFAWLWVSRWSWS